MADTFVFSNGAVAALQEAISQFDTSLQIAISDAARFPTLVGGAKFPIILADSEDNWEICYVTSTTGAGEFTVLRAQEGTAARSWSAGAQVEHTITAGSFLAAAALNPRGTWSAVNNYVARDVVVHNDISYLAVQPSINQVPSNVSAYWQVLYVPPGVSASALTRAGAWNSATTYANGALVTYQGRQWASLSAGNTNKLPTDPAWWVAISPTAGEDRHEVVLTAAGTNNYTVAPAVAPPALYDGLTLNVIFTNSNTAAATLTVGALAPVPLRPKKTSSFASGEIIAGALYRFQYLAGSAEFVAVSAPAFEKRITDLSNADGLHSARLLALEAFVSNFVGVMADFGAGVVPTGWLECAGQAVSRATYAALFTKIGTTHGAGDGSTTFNLPDSRERVTVGRGTNAPGGSPARLIPYYLNTEVAVVGGSQNIQQHNHTVTDPGHLHGVTDPGHHHQYTRYLDQGSTNTAVTGAMSTEVNSNNDTPNTSSSLTGISVNGALTGISVNNSGAGTTGNLQPFLVTTKMIFAGA